MHALSTTYKSDKFGTVALNVRLFKKYPPNRVKDNVRFPCEISKNYSREFPENSFAVDLHQHSFLSILENSRDKIGIETG